MKSTAIKKKKPVFPRLDGRDDDERVCAILEPEKPLPDDEDEFCPPYATEEMLAKYRDFLVPRLAEGMALKGMEDGYCFSWEEGYTLGYGTEEVYASVRKNNCSAQDKVVFISLLNEFNEGEGLLVEVERMSDKKIFLLPLCDFEARPKKSKEYQLLDDYSCWFVNSRCC